MRGGKGCVKYINNEYIPTYMCLTHPLIPSQEGNSVQTIVNIINAVRNLRRLHENLLHSKHLQPLSSSRFLHSWQHIPMHSYPSLAGLVPQSATCYLPPSKPSPVQGHLVHRNTTATHNNIENFFIVIEIKKRPTHNRRQTVRMIDLNYSSFFVFLVVAFLAGAFFSFGSAFSSFFCNFSISFVKEAISSP